MQIATTNISWEKGGKVRNPVGIGSETIQNVSRLLRENQSPYKFAPMHPFPPNKPATSPPKKFL